MACTELQNISDEMLCKHEEVLARKDNAMNMRIFDLQSRSQPDRNVLYGLEVLVFDEMQFKNRDVECIALPASGQAKAKDNKTFYFSSSNTFVNGLYCKHDKMYEYNHQMFNNLTKQLPYSQK